MTRHAPLALSSSALATLAASLMLTITACDAAPDPDVGERPAEVSVEFDIAEDMARFSFDEEPVFEDGLPAYGNAFVTQGYVYPAGFLDENAGTLPDGSPAQPEEVIGQWTCRGIFVGDGAHTTSGPMVITTQFVELFEEPGWDPSKAGTGDVIVSEGYELAEIGSSVIRAVTGGGGFYASASGQATQIFLGLNDSEGFNLRQHVELQ